MYKERLLELLDKSCNKLEQYYSNGVMAQLANEEIEDQIEDCLLLMKCASWRIKARDKRIAELELKLKEG